MGAEKRGRSGERAAGGKYAQYSAQQHTLSGVVDLVCATPSVTVHCNCECLHIRREIEI